MYSIGLFQLIEHYCKAKIISGSNFDFFGPSPNFKFLCCSKISKFFLISKIGPNFKRRIKLFNFTQCLSKNWNFIYFLPKYLSFGPNWMKNSLKLSRYSTNLLFIKLRYYHSNSSSIVSILLKTNRHWILYLFISRNLYQNYWYLFDYTLWIFYHYFEQLWLYYYYKHSKIIQKRSI